MFEGIDEHDFIRGVAGTFIEGERTETIETRLSGYSGTFNQGTIN